MSPSNRHSYTGELWDCPPEVSTTPITKFSLLEIIIMIFIVVVYILLFPFIKMLEFVSFIKD
jgi:hypothetical protein